MHPANSAQCFSTGGAFGVTGTEVMDVGRDALWLTIQLASPVLIVGLIVGVVIGLFQALTQIQEKRTAEIARAVHEVLRPEGVGVVIEAEHSCMTMRGVDVPAASLTTSHLIGVVRDDPRTREEFMRLARG